MSYKTLPQITKIIARDYELVTTAYHEAGHTISGILCYMQITSACVIDSEKRIRGETVFDTLSNAAYIDDQQLFAYDVKAMIYLSYAGLAVEKLYYKYTSGSSRFPIVLRDGSSLDIATAAGIIRKYNLSPSGKKRHAFKKRLFNEITEILESHWDDIRLLAHALFAKKKLNYGKIRNILCYNSKNKDFWREKFKAIGKIYQPGIDQHRIKKLIKMS